LLQRWLSATSRRTEPARNESRPLLVLETLKDRIVPANATPTFVLPPPPLGPSGPTPDLQGSGPDGFFDPSDLQTAYSIGSLLAKGYTGAGQTIAVIDAYDDPDLVSTGSSGFSTSDLEAFSSEFGLPSMDGLNGDPTFQKVNQTGGSTTTALDF
jgi:subtilase family serine protease